MIPASFRLQRAVHALRQGGLIVYPTEGVWGLGCDPGNVDAVFRLLALKQRPVDKGLILVAATIEQFEPLLEGLAPSQLKTLAASWPGPHTWLVPTNANVPPWIAGDHATVALRVSAHPVVAALCKEFGGPVVSTSANRSGKKPAMSLLEVQLQFSARSGEHVTVVPGELGGDHKATTITDLASGKLIRP